MADRIAETAVILDATGATRGAAEFERAAARVKAANAAVEAANAKATRQTDAATAATARATAATARVAAAEERARKVRASSTATAEKIAKAEAAVATARDKATKAATAATAATTRATTATEAAAAAQLRLANIGDGFSDDTVRIGDQAAALERLKRSLDPVYDAAIKLADGEAKLDRALQRGDLDLVEHTELVRKLRERYRDTDDAVDHLGHTTRRTGNRLQQLSPQISDIIATVGGGGSLGQAAIQQGPQIFDIFGGIPAVLGRIPGPIKVVAAAFAALAIAGGFAASRLAEVTGQARRFEAIAASLNPRLKGLSAELRNIVLETAERGAGRKEAGAAVEALLKQRGLQVEILKDLAGLSVDIAAVMQTDPAAEATALGDAFTKGAGGVKELADRLHFLTPELEEEIDRYERAGDRVNVYRVALEALTTNFGGKAKEMRSEWAKTLDEMAVNWNTFWDAVAKSDTLTGFAKWVAEQERLAREFWGSEKKPPAATGGEDDRTKRLKDLVAQMAALRKQTNEATAEATRLQEMADKIGSVAASKDEIDAAWARAAELEAKFKELAKEADQLEKEIKKAPPKTITEVPPERKDSRGLTDDEQLRINPQWRFLNDETAALRVNQAQRQISIAGLNAYHAAKERDASDAEATQERLIAEERARRDLNIAISDSNRLMDLDIEKTLAVADAYARSTEEGLRAQAMRQAAIDAETTGEDPAEKANRLLRQNAAQGRLAGVVNMNDLKADNENLKRVADASRRGPAAEEAARRTAEAEAMYRDRLQGASAAKDEHMVEVLIQERIETEGVLKARDDYNRKIAASAQYRQEFENDLEAVKLEAQLIYASNEERDREVGLLRLRQELVEQGYEGAELEAEIERLGRIVALRAKLTEETRRATREYERNKQAILDSVDIMRDGFDDLILRGEKFADVLRNISQAFLRMGTDLLVINPLKDFLTDAMSSGKMSGGSTSGGDSKGGIWSMLSSIGSAVVSAWSGNVAGAVAGASHVAGAAGPVTGVTTGTSGGYGGAPVIAVERVPLAHSGWHVGREPPPETRTVPTSIFVNAPRMHRGGLVAGERPTILMDGEEVLNQGDPRHRRNYQGRRATPTVVMNITTPDAASFRNSSSQIASHAGRALAMAQRRNG